MKTIKIELMVILLIMLSFVIQGNLFAQNRATDEKVPITTEIVTPPEYYFWLHQTTTEGDPKDVSVVSALDGGTPGDISETSPSDGGVSSDVSKASTSDGGISKDVSKTSPSAAGVPRDISGASSGARDEDELEFGAKFFSAIGGALNAFFDAIGL